MSRGGWRDDAWSIFWRSRSGMKMHIGIYGHGVGVYKRESRMIKLAGDGCCMSKWMRVPKMMQSMSKKKWVCEVWGDDAFLLLLLMWSTTRPSFVVVCCSRKNWKLWRDGPFFAPFWWIPWCRWISDECSWWASCSCSGGSWAFFPSRWHYTLYCTFFVVVTEL